jgi:hypothetical protein
VEVVLEGVHVVARAAQRLEGPEEAAVGLGGRVAAQDVERLEPTPEGSDQGGQSDAGDIGGRRGHPVECLTIQAERRQPGS